MRDRKITLTEEEVRTNQFLFLKADPEAEHKKGFYSLIREKLGVSKDAELDCRKISISDDIRKAWYAYFAEYGAPDWELTAMICCAGPKPSIELPERTVLFEPGSVVCANG